MANICDQRLFIVSENETAAKELLNTMSKNFEEATQVELLKGVAADASWDKLVMAMNNGVTNHNLLCLLDSDPDSGAESGTLSGSMQYGKPCIELRLGLKWHPSYQAKSFCESIDSKKYGCASINGGEYVCAMGDEFAHIQWGEDFGSPTEGIVDYDDYAEWAAKVKSSVPGDLNEIALWVLFDSVEPSNFFWKEANAGEFEQIEKADPGLLDEIAEELGYEDAEELLDWAEDVEDVKAMLWDLDDEEVGESFRKRLAIASRCDRGKNRGIDFDAIDAKDPNLLDEIAEYFDYESRADLIYELTDIYELADSSELCAWFSGSIEDEGEEERGEELLERLENILD